MKLKMLFLLVLAAAICCVAWAVQSQESKDQQVQPMYGGFLIDGYDFKNDNSPKGTIVYDEAANEFRGTYKGLKMPKGPPCDFRVVARYSESKDRIFGSRRLAKSGY